MSGHPDCPACHQRVVYQADGVTVALRDPCCTHRSGCVERDRLVATLLHDAGPVLEQMHGEAQQAADRARKARIQAAREAVLAEVRRWRREHPYFCGGGTNLLGAAADAWLAVEAEEGER